MFRFQRPATVKASCRRTSWFLVVWTSSRSSPPWRRRSRSRSGAFWRPSSVARIWRLGLLGTVGISGKTWDIRDFLGCCLVGGIWLLRHWLGMFLFWMYISNGTMRRWIHASLVAWTAFVLGARSSSVGRRCGCSKGTHRPKRPARLGTLGHWEVAKLALNMGSSWGRWSTINAGGQVSTHQRNDFAVEGFSF